MGMILWAKINSFKKAKIAKSVKFYFCKNGLAKNKDNGKAKIIKPGLGERHSPIGQSKLKYNF